MNIKLLFNTFGTELEMITVYFGFWIPFLQMNVGILQIGVEDAELRINLIRILIYNTDTGTNSIVPSKE